MNQLRNKEMAKETKTYNESIIRERNNLIRDVNKLKHKREVEQNRHANNLLKSKTDNSKNKEKGRHFPCEARVPMGLGAYTGALLDSMIFDHRISAGKISYYAQYSTYQFNW